MISRPEKDLTEGVTYFIEECVNYPQKHRKRGVSEEKLWLSPFSPSQEGVLTRDGLVANESRVPSGGERYIQLSELGPSNI